MFLVGRFFSGSSHDIFSGLPGGLGCLGMDTSWESPSSSPLNQGTRTGAPPTVYPWYLLCSLGILGDYNPLIPTI